MCLRANQEVRRGAFVVNVDDRGHSDDYRSKSSVKFNDPVFILLMLLLLLLLVDAIVGSMRRLALSVKSIDLSFVTTYFQFYARYYDRFTFTL